MLIEEKNDLFIELINKFNIKRGMEVGVRNGIFLKNILSRSDIEFYGVDINVRSSPKKLAEKYSNYTITKDRSPECASKFEDDFFDWIYIDAAHSYDAVKKDLEGWYPKLKTGGIFSGDDYMIFTNPNEGKYGIVEAVEEFVENNNIKEVYISHLGLSTKEERLKFAKETGEKWPWKGCKIPQWWFIKEV